ncbi:MAG: ABC transporter ATP-binding protein, partial [bacterium]|nr:ABC transporter ATP-binding protein [bacterium]
MNKNVLSLNGISKRYEQNQVLESLDFAVPEGTIMGLVGKNGAGKSTMIKCLLGLIMPDEGEATIFGEPSWNLSAACKHRIGYVPQTMASFGWMTVERMLAYTGAFYDHWNSDKVLALAKEWELDIYAKIVNLSEGERQKLAIVQAMGHEPDLFIFDEPVASLDPVARRQFIKQLIELNNNEGKSMLFSTHITSDLERVAADVALLKEGHIRFRGDLSSLKDRVYRLRIQAQKDLPNPLPIDGMVNCSVDGPTAVVTVDGLEEEAIPALEK